MKELTKTEEILLLTIWKLEDEAYGVKIRQYVSRVIKKEFTYGNLYSVLNQLVKKKYVTKTDGEIVPERRGRRRIYYTVTPQGLKALKAAREMNETLWADIPKYAFERLK
jgi:DNA-binding PadR family transcriptional regulator